MAVDVFPSRDERSIALQIPVGANGIPPLDIQRLFSLLTRTALGCSARRQLARRFGLQYTDRLLRKRGSRNGRRPPFLKQIGRIRKINCFLLERIGNLDATFIGINSERRAWRSNSKRCRSKKQNDMELLHNKARF